jgi:hypothetical protein
MASPLCSSSSSAAAATKTAATVAPPSSYNHFLVLTAAVSLVNMHVWSKFTPLFIEMFKICILNL